MKKKFYFILAIVASATIVSCTSDEYVGENPGTGSNDAITFGSGFKAVTRAGNLTGEDAATLLDNHFKVYGVKKVSTAWSDVFKNYIVWYNTTATSSNPDKDWEYVGTTSQTYGAANKNLPADQYIKYWDQSADNYHFVAGSPAANFTFNTNDGNIVSTVTGIAGHINANPGTIGSTTYSSVYISEPVNVSNTDFKKEVTLSFTRQQSFVRVGVYETIPGYRISDIHFYSYDATGWKTTAETTQNIILASQTGNYFTGATNAKATVSYNWTGTPSYTYTYVTDDTDHALTQQKNWYGGLLDGVKATSSTETTISNLYGTDKDMAASTGYFTVIPTASSLTAAPILVKCDYTLTSLDGSGEVINVTGATAAIPAAFTLWKPNTSYTYLFKISEDTNGKTGPDGPEGLFPITFDAVVKVEEDGTAQGIITTVSTPSITTYQEGSVTAGGIKYKYNSTTPSDTKPIYFTAQNEKTGALFTLTTGGTAVSNVQVYKLAGAATEADLQVKAPTTTFVTTLVSSATVVGSWTIPAGAAYFTPDAAGYYAIQYQTSADPVAYTYKIVYVE
jgi:hypothetical protein